MIFAYIENNKNFHHRLAFQTITYAKYIGDILNKKITVLTINPINNSTQLYKFGANKVIELYDLKLKIFDSSIYGEVLIKYFTGNYCIFMHTSESIAIASYISIKKNIPLITNVIGYPIKLNPIQIKRKSFGGKVNMIVESTNNSTLLTILPNSIKSIQKLVQGETHLVKNISIKKSKLDIDFIEESKNVSLTEADIIVSAGKGLKASKNWDMIEKLAKILGAGIACSKPVSDLGWRPHSEHVGQTGKTVSPVLYFAIALSGSIQHISGMNHSNIIIVINSDPNAPFFKLADYGIIGDAFVIVPKIIQLLNKKNNRN